jgi:hypothetical protein
MLGVAPHVRQRTRPSLGGEAGGRSPGFICLQYLQLCGSMNVVAEMMHVTPFFGFTLALVVPGALVILLSTLLWTGET